MIPVEGEDLFPVTSTKYPRAGYPGCGWGHVPIHEPVSVAGGRDGCSDWPGLGQGLCRAGALGSSPKENLELFSEMGEVDARQQKQQLSRKEGSTLRNEGRNQGRVPLPRQKGVGARDLAPSQKDAARAQKLGLHLVFFHHPCWFPVGRPVRDAEELGKPSPKFESQVLARKWHRVQA